MAKQTICPACGAPLTYTGTADEIRCPFCDTELQVLHENGQEHFRILSQPGPQKEVLSRPVEGGQPPARPSDVLADESPMNDLPPVVPPSAQDEFTSRTAAVIRPEPAESRPEEKPTAPGYPGFISDEANPATISSDRLHSEHSAQTIPVPDAPAFYHTHGPKVPVTGAVANERRPPAWVPIVLAVIIGLIIFMACAAGAWMMLSRITRAS